ncbi:MAG: ABC transporter permease [Clostridia bacterium]|nr:ABC transporter permease [Clostridia bacterium]
MYSFQGAGGEFTLENFTRFFNFSDPTYLKVLWRSIYLAAISTVICLLLGYPMAYILSKLPNRIRGILSFLFVLPMWMNFLLRTYAWMTLLERTGIINTFLTNLGLPTWDIMYTQGAVILGNVYNFLPFMILPIYNVLIKIDKSVLEASADLGGNGSVTFRKVIFPLSIPGVISGISMTFMPAVTTFVISKLLGGGQNALIGDLIENQFKVTGDWGFGSAMSVILMVLILAAMQIMQRYEDENDGSGGVLL